MQSVKLRSHVGQDGILKLEVPLGFSETDLEVVVIVQPVTNEPARKASWPPGFFKRVIGGWKGELVREPQGEYEVRKPLE
jgi:hypothetical protein